MKKILFLVAMLPFVAVGDDRRDEQPSAEQAQGQLQGQAQGQLQGQAQGNFNAVDVNNVVRSTATSGSFSGSESSSAAQSESSSESSAASDSSATQSQSASADNSGNAQTVNFSVPEKQTIVSKQDGAIEVRSVPTAIAPNIYPTASCAMSASVGASALGWGASAGGTKVNHECVMLETARVFSQLGYQSQGLDVLCATKVSLDVFGSREACLAGQRIVDPGAAPSVVVLPAGVSREVVTEQIDRAFKATVSK